MNTLALALLTALAVVCLGIPLTAIAVVYREELLPLLARVRSALAFDPRHAAFSFHHGR